MKSLQQLDMPLNIYDISVFKEGTNYAISLVLKFDESKSMKEVYKTKEAVKQKLMSESLVNKVSIDFVLE